MAEASSGVGDGADAAVVIRPIETSLIGDLRETMRYRGLIGAMALRQFRVEYASAWFGWLWILARPLAMLAVFTLFKRLASARVGETMPYPLYLYSGLILWFFFVAGVEGAAGALERDAGLVRKVYFPRLVSPTASVVAELLALAVSALPLLALLAWHGVTPSWTLLLAPLLVAQMLMLIIGVGAIFSVLSLQSADWRRALSLCLYLGLFLSPVIYAPAMIPPAAQWLYHLNPLVGPLLALRAMLVDGAALPLAEWGYSWAVSALVFLAGVGAFHRFERYMLDKL